MAEEQDCRQCGKCCEKWGWDQKGIVEDLVPWIAGGRTDILSHVGIRFHDGRRITGRDLTPGDLPEVAAIHYWTDAEGNRMRSCPFFFRAEDGKVYCRIHTAKPKVCTNFRPWNEGIRDYALSCPACRDTVP